MGVATKSKKKSDDDYGKSATVGFALGIPVALGVIIAGMLIRSVMGVSEGISAGMEAS